MVELIQLFVTICLVGLIWFVQIIHYPLFTLVGNDPSYYAAHQRRTTWLVLPLMGTELITAIALCFLRNQLIDYFALLLLVGIWSSTIWLQIPCHKKLLTDYSADVVERLVQTNWIRTILWSLRAAILLSF